MEYSVDLIMRTRSAIRDTKELIRISDVRIISYKKLIAMWRPVFAVQVSDPRFDSCPNIDSCPDVAAGERPGRKQHAPVKSGQIKAVPRKHSVRWKTEQLANPLAEGYAPRGNPALSSG